MLHDSTMATSPSSTMETVQKTVQSSVQSTVQSVRHLISTNTTTHDHTTLTSNNTGDSEENPHHATRRSPRLSFRKQGTNQNASPLQTLRSSWRASNVHKKSRMPPKRSTIQQDPPKETPSTNISSTPQNDTDHSPLPSSVRSSLRHVRNALTLRMPSARATQEETVQKNHHHNASNDSNNHAEQPRGGGEHHDSSSTTEKHETPNVAANPHVLNGKLREVPSFVINFQVAWGNVIFYFAIPEKFVPYLRAGQEANVASSSSNSNISKKDYLRQVDASENLLPSEKSLCRFLLQDEAHKTAVLKILPHVEQGPWVARMACQKPALIGKVIPIQYHYHAGDADHAPYLEADFNINSSSAAKPILQVARSCTKTLTLDLGFVIQGNTPDELPEQMLVGCRLHAIDPDSALAFPTEKEPPRSESTLPSYRSDSSESLEETAA